MTGVIKSNRCGTCRKRKVKCDEVKPVCGPCLKSARTCEDPISKVKFAKPKGVHAGQIEQDAPIKETQVSLAPGRDMAILRSATKDGGSFQTLRLSHYMRPRDAGNISEQFAPVKLMAVPALSPIEKLQVTLLDTFNCLNPGLRLSLISDYVRQIPSRLGHCAALDDSMACLLNAHAALCQGNDPYASRGQPKLYAQALLSLQAGLKDPTEAYSDNILCAVTLMGYVELLGGGSHGPEGVKYVQHAGGATKLLQIRGPAFVKDSFSKVLYANTIGLAIVHAFLRSEDCFLTEPQWEGICVKELCLSVSDERAVDLGKLCTRIPSLIRRFRELYLSSIPSDYTATLEYGQQLKTDLRRIEEFVDSKLQNGVDIVRIPSARGDALVPVVYHFSDRSLANICTIFWGFSMVVDTTIARLLDPGSAAQETLRNRCIDYRQHICMSFEYSIQFWPLGSMFIVAPLTIAYRGATEEEKEWMMNSIWTITNHIPQHQRSWGRLGLEISTRYFFGDPINIVPDHEYGTQTDKFTETWKDNARMLGLDDEL